MTAVASYDDIVNRIGGKFYASQPIYDFIGTAGLALGGNNNNYMRCGRTVVMPSLPAGVTGYIPTLVTAGTSDAGGNTILVAKLINLGSLDINTPTFTDANPMPTVTELNQSRVTAGPVLIEVTTVLSATPGSITITYTDQDNNGTETTTAQALTAASPVGSSGWIVLNGTDTGVRDITSATRTGGTVHTGVVKFWGVIPISLMTLNSTANILASDNLITCGFNFQKLGAGDTVGVFVSGTAIRGLYGEIFYVGDS